MSSYLFFLSEGYSTHQISKSFICFKCRKSVLIHFSSFSSISTPLCFCRSHNLLLFIHPYTFSEFWIFNIFHRELQSFGPPSQPEFEILRLIESVNECNLSSIRLHSLLVYLETTDLGPIKAKIFRIWFQHTALAPKKNFLLSLYVFILAIFPNITYGFIFWG